MGRTSLVPVSLGILSQPAVKPAGSLHSGGRGRRAERSQGCILEARMSFGVLIDNLASRLFPVSFWTRHLSAHLISGLHNAISKQQQTQTASCNAKANQETCPVDHLPSHFICSSSWLCPPTVSSSHRHTGGPNSPPLSPLTPSFLPVFSPCPSAGETGQLEDTQLQFFSVGVLRAAAVDNLPREPGSGAEQIRKV